MLLAYCVEFFYDDSLIFFSDKLFEAVLMKRNTRGRRYIVDDEKCE